MILSSHCFVFDQGQRRSFAGVAGASSVGCLDQLAQLGGRVLAGDVPGGAYRHWIAHIEAADLR